MLCSFSFSKFFLDFLYNDIFIVLAAIVKSSSSIDYGFCDQDLVNITLKIDCNFTVIYMRILADLASPSNFNLQCENVSCVVNGNTSMKYLLKDQTLDVSFPFQYRDHGGKFITFQTTCQNRTILTDPVLLRPCGKYRYW